MSKVLALVIFVNHFVDFIALYYIVGVLCEQENKHLRHYLGIGNN